MMGSNPHHIKTQAFEAHQFLLAVNQNEWRLQLLVAAIFFDKLSSIISPFTLCSARSLFTR